MDAKVLGQFRTIPGMLKTERVRETGITVSMSKETFDSHISKARAGGIEFGQNHLVEILYGFMVGIHKREEIFIKLEGPAAEERLIHVMNALDKQLTLDGHQKLQSQCERIRRALVNQTSLNTFTVDVLVDSIAAILKEST